MGPGAPFQDSPRPWVPLTVLSSTPALPGGPAGLGWAWHGLDWARLVGTQLSLAILGLCLSCVPSAGLILAMSRRFCNQSLASGLPRHCGHPLSSGLLSEPGCHPWAFPAPSSVTKGWMWYSRQCIWKWWFRIGKLFLKHLFNFLCWCFCF